KAGLLKQQKYGYGQFSDLSPRCVKKNQNIMIKNPMRYVKRAHCSVSLNGGNISAGCHFDNRSR
ncbi:hypothetical protein, partial [Klebsiella quasipneumoniae]|uniref:hypothetical protein n=1 Tax=Klebsiella quasipneumoniae TaxID=1463165 RepID=UPI001A911C32